MNDRDTHDRQAPPSILIIDDTVGNLRLLSGMLSEQQYRVRPVSDGQLALSSAKLEPPDLILLDIMMPGLSGFDVCERLKSDENTREIPIIFISALNEVFDKVKAFSLGGVDFISKPFHAEEVLARVETHLRTGTLQKRLSQSNLRLQEEIAERRQAEESLKTSEERYRRLVEHSPDAIVVHHQWTALYANAAAEKLFGIYGQEAWHQKELLECIAPDCHQRIRERSREIEELEPAQPPLELKLLGKDGHSVYAEMTGAPIVYHGHPAMQAIFRDISPRKETEEQLQKLKKAIETTEVGITITDRDGRIEYVNPADAIMHGYGVKELIGERSNIFSPEEFHQEHPISEKHFQRSPNWKRERINARKDGTTFPVRLISNPLLDRQERFSGMVTVCEDISEYRAAEKLLQESELRYRSMFENTTTGIFQTSLEGRFLTVNPALAGILGYPSPDDLIEQVTDVAEQVYVEPEHWQEIADLLGIIREPVKVETRCRCRDGREIIVNLSVWSVGGEDEPPRYFEGFIEDISERKRVEEALNKRESYLAALVQIQRRLLEFEGESAYEEILCLLGKSSHTYRVSFFENVYGKDGKISAEQRWYWQDDTLLPLTEYAKPVKLLYDKDLPACFPLLDRGQTISQHVDDFQEPEHSFLQNRGSYSLLMLPVMVGGVFFGFISLEDCRETRVWDPSEISLLQTAVAAISLAKEQQLSEQRVQQHAAALQKANEELAITLNHLETAQEELIQSEKMAALGQLIAGIAHEINTPLGAIRSAVGSMADSLDQTLGQLPEFFRNLPKDSTERFFTLLARALRKDPTITAKERRDIRKHVMAFLKEHDIPQARKSADLLVDMGIHGDLEMFLPLFLKPDSLNTISVAYELSGLQESTHIITTATERASKVVFALKTFARYDRTESMIDASLREGIETVLTLYHNQLKHGVIVQRNYQELPPIFCYPDELNQVWTNLIHNALQAMKNQGTLTIDIARKDQQAIVSISDTGGGIPESVKAKIFEPFFTTKPAGEGSGLGLDIVRKIIEKHHGRIEVESEPGNTMFSVWLPMQATEKTTGGG